MRLGVDLGGTKIEIVALDGLGRLAYRERASTPRGNYRAIVTAIADLVAAADARLGVAGTVGVGIPGSISPATGLVKNANTTELIGQAFDRDLADRIGRPVRLENDANCFVLSEASDGAGAGCATVFGVIVGTGCGGGVVVNGQVLRGRQLIAGEWGHNPLPWPSLTEIEQARLCYCGRRGCLETWISGTGFAVDHRRATGRDFRAEEIVATAAVGDEQARAAFARYVDRLARGLAAIVNVLDPDTIVLGGGMSNVVGLVEVLPEAMRPFVFSDVFDTPIHRAAHGDSSGVRGAAWLWPNNLR